MCDAILVIYGPGKHHPEGLFVGGIVSNPRAGLPDSHHAPAFATGCILKLKGPAGLHKVTKNQTGLSGFHYYA